MSDTLRVRWLGRTDYDDALELQHRLHEGTGSWLLLLEHPHTYTMGVRAKREHVLVDPADVGARLVWTDRGGDVTYHGPGQLVAYPIVDVPVEPDSTPRYVHRLEQVLIETLAEFQLAAFALDGYPGVWVDAAAPRKIAAIGVKLTRGRSLHGIALNVTTDLGMFGHIVPCGIPDKPVTSMAAEGVRVSVEDVARVFARRFAVTFGLEARSAGVDWPVAQPASSESATSPVERRLQRAGVSLGEAVPFHARKPAWVRPRVRHGSEVLELKRLVGQLSLVTVCEEAGCPNLSECWKDGTATFMINGERCTRACTFCLVDTSHPLPLDPGEPDRVAAAVAALDLEFAVVTAVARDDLADGGAEAFARTIRAIKLARPTTRVEVLIPDFKGSAAALDTVLEAGPDVLNHNLETVLRLQRAVRPSAHYARSLAVLSRAQRAGFVTKSGLMVGLGESFDELREAMGDLAAAGVSILTVGQYLRPTQWHAPVARYWHPEEFDMIRDYATELGFRFVEASPLARSSYHAKRGSDAAQVLAERA
ncbi:lipoic acid synthetase [Acidimicrobium ferrooxidans DSM 10331]|uniref:Multifunctional fusion protein n=1 Tax=Acidimicrobium ferrooxidans (strain DSM 10331 / JCM 15462 / NBRC 103882 / ICP) TaxID=525909 RepID=C7LY61_ACIFD|nr:lipoic acid synthetase [Acidimicrobium ferrooxidans DSM 10331]